MRAALARAVLAALLGLTGAASARADEARAHADDEPTDTHAPHAPSMPRHRLSAGVGVPVPLRAYGGDASLDAAGVSLRLAAHGRATYSVRWLDVVPALRLGARGSVSVVSVSDGELSLWGYVGAIGAHAGVAIAPLRALEVELGAGPALARSGFRIDAELQRAFWAPALYAFGSAAWSLAPEWSASLELAIEHVMAAPADAAFFNQRLGSTTLLASSLGVQHSF